MRILYQLLVTTALMLGVIPRPALAQECTRAGWCIRNSVSGTRVMYKYLGRSGNFVYILSNYDEGRGFVGEVETVYDCKNWKVRNSQVPWSVIVPDSIVDGIANQLC